MMSGSMKVYCVNGASEITAAQKETVVDCLDSIAFMTKLLVNPHSNAAELESIIVFWDSADDLCISLSEHLSRYATLHNISDTTFIGKLKCKNITGWDLSQLSSSMI